MFWILTAWTAQRSASQELHRPQDCCELQEKCSSDQKKWKWSVCCWIPECTFNSIHALRKSWGVSHTTDPSKSQYLVVIDDKYLTAQQMRATISSWRPQSFCLRPEQKTWIALKSSLKHSCSVRCCGGRDAPLNTMIACIGQTG